jgi:hypothetical protein
MRVFVKPIHGGKHVPYKTGDRSIDATIEDLAEVMAVKIHTWQC